MKRFCFLLFLSLFSSSSLFDEITEEWRFITKNKMEKDIMMIKLITNPEYSLPKIAPKF